MVKILSKIILIMLPVSLCVITSCFQNLNQDILGIFASNDLDERLKEKDSFKLLSDDDRNPDWGDEYSFLLLADTHILNGKSPLFDGITGELGARINDADLNVQFAVVLGDITENGKREDLEKFIDFAGNLGVPCYPVIGNHDIYFDNWSVWKELIGSTSYQISDQYTTLIILDSANGFFGKAQLDWLEEQLKETAGQRVFIFTHYNFFADSYFPLQQFPDVRERARFISILKDRCDIMFMGHGHTYHQVVDLGGVKYLALDSVYYNHSYYMVSVRPGGIDIIKYGYEEL